MVCDRRVADVLFGRLVHYSEFVNDRPLRVFDLNSRSGKIPIRIACRAKSFGLNLDITMTFCDPSQQGIQQELAERMDVVVRSMRFDLARPSIPSCDVILCDSVLHLLDEHQVFTLLQAMQQSADRAFLVSDLKRSRVNALLLPLQARLLSGPRNLFRPVCPASHDMAALVRSSYTPAEVEKIAHMALARPVQMESLFPGHFLLIADETIVPVATPAFASC